MVAHTDARTVHEFGVVHDAHAEAGKVIFPVAVHAGHLGRLAAEEGATRLTATLGDAADDRMGRFHIQTAGGEIIEEKEWQGPLHQDVVDAHGNEVDAHGIVLVEGEGQLELGAHAVGARNEDRVAHAAELRAEQAAEAADIGDDALGVRAGNKMFDAAHEIVARLDVDAGFPVGFGAFRGHKCLLATLVDSIFFHKSQAAFPRIFS